MYTSPAVTYFTHVPKQRPVGRQNTLQPLQPMPPHQFQAARASRQLREPHSSPPPHIVEHEGFIELGVNVLVHGIRLEGFLSLDADDAVRIRQPATFRSLQVVATVHGYDRHALFR